MKKIVAPVFISACQVLFAAVLFAVVPFAVGGDATALATFWLVTTLSFHWLVLWAYREGASRE